ncbi:MAG: aldehyde dehydrogenase (NADP(+)) [Planctomycetia bacterium]|nr:aldehyde dehydrogenase (NADP(+)) [Planctomycetia bacterium]
MSNLQSVLIAGTWRKSEASGTFQSANPQTGEKLAELYPISTWSDCEAALASAAAAFQQLRALPPARIAAFLRAFADRLQARGEELAKVANLETGYPVKPRLFDVELPSTIGQLRQAAAAAEEESWSVPTIDSKLNIRARFEALGPVAVFGPNNFPFAFGSASGGDFAAAIAAGCPVIAKANTSHPATTRLLAEEAQAAAVATEMPVGTIQLLYRTSHADGERFVADPRLGAIAYTGSRNAGLKLKAAADSVGKPIYLELSSVNPVVVLPGCLEERGDALVDEFTTSCLMGTGQFCTNPGLVLLVAGPKTESFIGAVAKKFEGAPVGALLSSGVADSLAHGVATLAKAGAKLLAGGKVSDAAGFRYQNTLLTATAAQFIADPHALQTECFGNQSLFVVAKDVAELIAALKCLEGNLTGCVYSDTKGSDDAAYDQLVGPLRERVGRLLNDKMPTGVAVSAAMNHGGPFPATGHPGFTAVGIPAAIHRFAMLACYDNVREHRLPASLKNKNVSGKTWRLVDGSWSQADVAAG